MRLRRFLAVIIFLLLLPGCGGRSVSHRPFLSVMDMQKNRAPLMVAAPE